MKTDKEYIFLSKGVKVVIFIFHDWGFCISDMHKKKKSDSKYQT